MTVEDVKELCRLVRLAARTDCDDEKAHAYEDDMLVAVLTAIANGAPNAPELAREALRTQDLNFSRHCA